MRKSIAFEGGALLLESKNSAGKMGNRPDSYRDIKHILTAEDVLEKNQRMLMKTKQRQTLERKLQGTTYYILDAQGNTMSVYERTVDTEEESVAFAQTEKHIYASSRLGMHNQPVPMLGSENDTYSMTYVNHRIGEKTYELSNHLGNVLSVVSDKLMPVQEQASGTIIDFGEDKFDADGDFLGWNYSPYPGGVDTAFVDNGTITSSAFYGISKYADLITTDIPYSGGNWVTNYNLSFDIISLSPSAKATVYVDGYSGFQDYYTTGPQNYYFTSSPYLSGNIFFNDYSVNIPYDTIELDNIKLTHDTPPYQYYTADIRQSTDYSPFGVTLDNRNLTLVGAEKMRYGFNGKELDNELKGEGNSYDFGARMLDPRLGRWLTIDPLAVKYPNISPYTFVANMPTIAIDPNGEEIIIGVVQNKEGMILINITFSGKLVNESSWPILSQEKLAGYLFRAKQSSEQVFNVSGEYIELIDDNGNKVSGPYQVSFKFDVTIASESNPINECDDVIRISSASQIPLMPEDRNKNGDKYAQKGTKGYSPYDMMVIYISNSILELYPAIDSEHMIDGRVVGDDPQRPDSFERTVSHEIGHRLGYYGHTDEGPGKEKPEKYSGKIRDIDKGGLLMNKGSNPKRGLGISTTNIKEMVDEYRKGNLNQGGQVVKP